MTSSTEISFVAWTFLIKFSTKCFDKLIRAKSFVKFELNRQNVRERKTQPDLVTFGTLHAIRILNQKLAVLLLDQLISVNKTHFF